jgi:magnesium chelatase family protein
MVDARSSRVHAAVVANGRISVVDVEVKIEGGLPETILVGVPASDQCATRDRVRAAMVNSGEPWPASKMTIRVTPPRYPERGCSLDLAIAMAVIAAEGRLPNTDLWDSLFYAELGLDGRLHPSPDVASVTREAVASGCGRVVVALDNVASALEVPGISVFARRDLKQLVHSFRRLRTRKRGRL